MSQSFMPHGMCYLWQPDLLFLHVISDGAIALAYFSIPLAIVYFLRNRRDFEYRWVLALFAAFIVTCGITHMLAIWVVWNPDYWIDGTAKAVTATISVLTAVVLWPLLPKLLALPSPVELETANQSLRNEVARRVEAQVDLESLNRDLEERVKQRTLALERSNSELEQFAFHASHDLKAPLRAIDLLSQWVAAELPEQTTGDLAKNLSLMQSRVRRMQSLLDDLLAYARVGAGDDRDLISVGDLMDEVLLLAAAPLKFTITVNAATSDISVRRMPLQQALLNLVGNAIKHHDREDGRIEIGIRESESQLVITVADDGPGIPPEFHAAVFDMYRTLTSKDESESSGIGLAIVRKAADYAGGSVSLESNPGRGTTFTLHWPKS